MKFIVSLFLFFLSYTCIAQITSANPTLSIGIVGDKTIKSLGVEAKTGRYVVTNDKGDTLLLMAEGDVVNLTVADWKLNLKTNEGNFTSKYFTLTAIDSTATFSLATPTLKNKPVYDGSLRLAANGGKIKLVNQVLLEQYVDDVLRAEVGKKHTYELYRVQAVISRTYALTNINKHKAEFFNLCDKVHCQVYHGKGYPNNSIDSATIATRGEVIVYENKTIDAAFHANCGGQTVNSEDVWNHPLPYLRSVLDTFCIRSNGAYWEKCIKADDWVKYFINSAGFTPGAKDTLLFQFDQTNRTLYYLYKNKKIPLKQMRSDFKLRSTFFSVYKSGDEVILCGRGFGHGVGMCQEGASEMARKGYNYQQVIQFYYKGVNIVPITTLIVK